MNHPPHKQQLLTIYFTGELLASAGDDGNVLLWTPTENPALHSNLGDDGHEDLEHWRVKTMCRSSTGSEIYDLAWSPDGTYFVTGSMDNVARIYNASTGACAPNIQLYCLVSLTWLRSNCKTNRRAQPLRPRRCLGPSQRVYRHSVFRQICPHLRAQK